MKLDKQKNLLDEWQTNKVSDIFDYLSTHAISRENLETKLLEDGEVGNIHYGDIHATYKATKIDLQLVPIPVMKDGKFKPDDEDLLMSGDLVMSDASEDYDGIGVTVLIDGVKNKKVVGGLHTFVLRDMSGKSEKFYRQYIFRNPLLRKELKRIATGVSVYGISKTNLSKVVVNLPPLPEQRRIVSVLETWDSAIEKLARKIAIKKNIKKGLMQKLLTGKMRLPGFSGEWKEYIFDEIFTSLKKPLGLKTTSYEAEGWPIFDQAKDVYISGYTKDKRYLHDFRANGPVILFGDHSRVIKYINEVCAFGNDGIKLFMVKPSFDNLFALYLLKNYRIPDTGYNRHFKYINNAIFTVPPIEEQAEVSDLLGKIDLEIKFMNKKLINLNNQKRFLLNSLVTGKIKILVGQ